MAPEREPSSSSQNSSEHPSPLYILFSALGVLWLFSKLSTPIQNPNRSSEQGDDTNDERKDRKGNSVIVSQVPPSPTNPANAAQCKYERTPTWEKVLAIIGVSAAVIYAGINLMMWYEMQKQTRMNYASVLLTVRPMIGFVGNRITVEHTPSGLRVSYRLKNYGQIPGRRLVFTYDVIGENEIKQMKQWSYPDLCTQAVADSRDPKKPALTIYPEMEVQFSKDDLVVPKIENPTLRICLCYHNWGTQGIYTTALYWSLDRDEIVNVEDGTEGYLSLPE